MIQYGRRMTAAGPKVDHLATLQKFIYRLEADLSAETRARLNPVIATYTRLYAHA